MFEMSGDILLNVLEATRLVNGREILACEPNVFVEDAETAMVNGSLGPAGSSRVVVCVKINREAACA